MLALVFLSLAFSVPIAMSSAIDDAWEMDRPSKTLEFPSERVENASTNDDASVGIGVQIHAYRDDSGSSPFDGRDGVELRVAATANTRKGVNYLHLQYGHLLDGFPNPEYMEPTNITGDNAGTWIDLPFGVYFYGGYGLQNESGCYDKVWISSNGFLSFTSSSNRTYGAIPDPYEPNAVLAVYWTDLNPSGGSIKYAKWGDPGATFVVVWDNVRNDLTGARETFGVVIKDQMCSPFWVRGQHKIRFLYKDVSGDTNAVIGLEDQEGYKGHTLDPANVPTGEDEILFCADVDAAEIREITIKLEKFDNKAEIFISTDKNELRGCNLHWEEQTPAEESIYEIAIKGGATLLISKIMGIGNPYGGLIWGGTLLVYKFVKAYAKSTWPVQSLDDTHVHAGVDDTFAYINASGAHIVEADWPVDASLEDMVYWVFNDQNTDAVEHSVKVYAELEYYSYKYLEMKTISTSVDLKITPDICNDFSNPKEVYFNVEYKGCLDSVGFADMYKVNVENDGIIDITMTPPGDANYDLYLYNGPSEDYMVASSTQSGNATESISYVTDSAGYWYVKVKRTYWEGHVNNGIYKLKLEWTPFHDLTVRTYDTGGSQITNVKVWIDGTRYYSPVTVTVTEGSHTVKAEYSFTRSAGWTIWIEYTFDHWEGDDINGRTSSSVTVYVTEDVTIRAYYEKEVTSCPTLFVWNGSAYVYETLLDIHAESDVTVQHQIEQPLAKDGHFYKLSLRELDNFTSHIDQVRLYAVDSEGETHLCPLAKAVHNELGKVTTQLMFDDETRVDLQPAQTIDLKFTYHSEDIAYFIFEINGHNKKIEP